LSGGRNKEVRHQSIRTPKHTEKDEPKQPKQSEKRSRSRGSRKHEKASQKEQGREGVDQTEVTLAKNDAFTNIVRLAWREHEKMQSQRALQDRRVPPPADRLLDFGEDDQESSSAKENENDLPNWPEAELQQFASDVSRGLQNLGDKQKELSLEALIAMLDSMPEEILLQAGLRETQKALKKFTRSPCEDKVRELLLAMQKAADQAMARHCLQAEGAPQKSLKDAEGTSEDDARTAAFTAWAQYEVQAFCAEAEHTLQDVGTNEGGKFPKATALKLAAKIPGAVVLHYPAVLAAAKVIEEHRDDMVANTDARRAMTLLVDCGTQAEEFWQLHRGGATAKSARNA